MDDISPQVIVSGAAGGIGSAVASAFAARGLRVLGVDRFSLEEARERGILVTTDYPVSQDYYEHLVADLADEDAMARLCQRLDGSRIQHAVSVAGGAVDAEVGQWDITKVSAAALAQSLTSNLLGQMLFAQAVLPALRENAPSSLSFTSSINGLVGAGLHAYSAAKAGLVSLTRTLAVGEAEHGVRVNTVAPGTVVTPRTQMEWADYPEHFARMAESTALRRCATPGEVAATFVALALDMTAITGQTLVVDAGQTARWR